MPKRKIVAVNLTVYLEQDGRPAQPTKTEVADSLIFALEDTAKTVIYGRDRLAQEMRVIGVYSNVASDDAKKKGPDVQALRLGTEG